MIGLRPGGGEGRPGGLESGLARTRVGWRERLRAVFGPVDITPALWEDLEAQLIQSDVGVDVVAAVVAEVRRRGRRSGVSRAQDLWRLLRDVLVEEVVTPGGRRTESRGPGVAVSWGAGQAVVVVVGINGAGKTTTAAKLAALGKSEGRAAVLVAGDTFRAAGVEQLEAWGQRIGVEVLTGDEGADPAAVVFDALGSAAAGASDLIVVDTAGRLNTQHNLMAELAKIVGVCRRVRPEARRESLLVLDATTGQNGLAQAKAFAATADVSGVVLCKLDSSAKGGVALAVRRELGVPLRFVGTGEGPGDLEPFEAEAFVDGLLGRIGPEG